MILRVFHAFTHPGMDRDFAAFLKEIGGPMLAKQPGCLGFDIGRTRWGGPPHFVVVSRWESLDALKGFVGDDYRRAVILPEEAHLVAEVSVEHFETF